ncbi:MAG: hypothetical protein C5B55_12250 [Blastocatellia bacterium]|nr:MAG: hypothetical protein C5B55_12250 [Blastocatellia bacterium]
MRNKSKSMVSNSVLTEHHSATGSLIDEFKNRGWNWKTCGGAFGLGGGIIAPLFGAVLTAIAWLTGPQWHGLPLQRVGAVLLFLTVPLLLFGAHCMDLSDGDLRRRKTNNTDESR